MNTDLGYLAVDSQVDQLGDCCDGQCNQGRLCPRRIRQASPAALVFAMALVPLAVIAAVALVCWGAGC